MIRVDDHPLLALGSFTATFATPLGELESPDWLDALCRLGASTGLEAFSPELKANVRDLLRASGFKPNGRNKPCNEYMQSAAAKGRFPRINAAVDLCNAAVLHGGLPISHVDLDRLQAPLSVRIAEEGKFAFNASGQLLDARGLLCLHDAQGPCADAVKDAHRAKTHAQTTRTLSVVWAPRTELARRDALLTWYMERSQALGAEVQTL